jgi:hypothetical protein
MNKEIAKVLTMVQEEKISAEEGAELIELLKEEETAHSSAHANYLKKNMRIKINSSNGDKVNVNLPISLVKTLLNAGHHIVENLPESEKYVKAINMELLLDAIENELEGQIVDITTANQDTIMVVIE